MNIFFLDKSPLKSAEILMAKSPQRARKFIIEFMQATAVLCEKNGLPLPIKKDGTTYKTKLASRFPKPILEWLGKSRNNFSWVAQMAFLLDMKVWQKDYNFNGNLTAIPNDQIIRDCGEALPHIQKTSDGVNYAKSKAKGLDFTHLPLHEAYNLYLDAQL